MCILDNVSDLDLLFQPGILTTISTHGKLLVTTRISAAIFNDSVEKIELDGFDDTLGSKLMLNLLEPPMWIDGEEPWEDNDLDTARQISHCLGGLPLALIFAASAIKHHHMTIAAALSYFKGKHQLEPSSDDLSFDPSQFWTMSFQSLREDSRHLLGLLSQFGPDSLPEDVLYPSDSSGVQLIASLPDWVHFCGDAERYTPS